MPRIRITPDDLSRKILELAKAGAVEELRSLLGATGAAGSPASPGGTTFANPMGAVGEMIRGGTAGAPLAIGAPSAAGKVLTSAAVTGGFAGAWADPTTDAEAVRDAVGAALVEGAGIDITVDDPGDAITIASTITQYTDEQARDAIGAALVAGSGVTITVDDPSDTITIAATGGGGYTDEQAQDAVGGILSDAGDIDFTYDDATPAITAAVKADAITYAKLQNVSATDKLLGRSTAGAGDVEEIACTAAGRAILDDADAAAQRATLGLAIGTDVQAWDALLDLLAALADPGADRLLFWDDSAGALDWLTAGTGLSIAGTTITASGGGGGGGGVPWASGFVYDVSSMPIDGTHATASISQDTLYAIPIVPPADATVDQISIAVTAAAAAGKLARLGIYADSGGRPGALIVDVGTVTIDGTGARTVAISPTEDLVGGTPYWLAVVANAGATIRSFTSATTLLGSTDVNQTAGTMRVNRAYTFAALPDPWGTVSTYSNAAFRIGLQVA